MQISTAEAWDGGSSTVLKGRRKGDGGMTSQSGGQRLAAQAVNGKRINKRKTNERTKSWGSGEDTFTRGGRYQIPLKNHNEKGKKNKKRSLILEKKKGKTWWKRESEQGNKFDGQTVWKDSLAAIKCLESEEERWVKS